jgi:hypothetical protein
MAPKFSHIASFFTLSLVALVLVLVLAEEDEDGAGDWRAGRTMSPFPFLASGALSQAAKFSWALLSKRASRLSRVCWSAGAKRRSFERRDRAWWTYSRWHLRNRGNVHHLHDRRAVWRAARSSVLRVQNFEDSGSGRKSGVKKSSREPGFVLLNASRISQV